MDKTLPITLVFHKSLHIEFSVTMKIDAIKLIEKKTDK